MLSIAIAFFLGAGIGLLLAALSDGRREQKLAAEDRRQAVESPFIVIDGMHDQVWRKS